MAEFDYIVVGGGSAGCVLAARLSENAQARVLLLEAGGRDGHFWIHVPAGFSKTLDMPGLNWRFETEPEESTAGRAVPIPRGRVLGGSSSINGMLYVRGQAQDYDQWAQMGNRGWSHEDLLPYFKRSEDYRGGDPALRGRGGPLTVSDTVERSPILDAWIAAGAAAGFPRNPDYNGASQEGFGYYQTTIRRGRRWSTARAFLQPALARPNLKVETGAHATRVLLEGRRAVGVEYRQGGELRQARCRGEVVLTAGAIQSPQLLELSGIGEPELLRRHGIEVAHAAPDVGEHYRDHFCTRISWRVKLPITLNEQSRGHRLAWEVLKYAVARRGILTLTAGIVFGFVRTRPELETPDVQYHIAHASYGDIKTRKLDTLPGMTVAVCQLRPESRGSIHLKSPDPHAPPSIRPNFLATPLDRETLLAGMRLVRRLAGSPEMAAYTGQELAPGGEVQSDAELLEWSRRNGATVYHPVGTCRMGPEPAAVVDDRLRVRGIAGLRVADAAICPTQISGNTNAPVIMIAEKAADLLREAARASAAPEAA